MTQYLTGTRGDLSAWTYTAGVDPRGLGTQIPVVLDTAATGVLVGVGTYYFPFGSERSSVPTEVIDVALHMRWALAVAGVATIEVCNFPQTISGNGQGGIDVPDWDPVLGDWVLYNPTQAGALYAAALGAGNSMAALTLTLGGTTAGGAIWNIPDFAFKRGRIKLVTTAGGIVRPNISGKLGA